MIRIIQKMILKLTQFQMRTNKTRLLPIQGKRLKRLKNQVKQMKIKLNHQITNYVRVYLFFIAFEVLS
jgi:hypothetical protein